MVFKIFFILFFRYLENEYIYYCVLSNVLSGLGRLSLSYVWYDGVEDKNRLIDLILLIGESLSGFKVYSLIMLYFIINNMNVFDVYDLGIK